MEKNYEQISPPAGGHHFKSSSHSLLVLVGCDQQVLNVLNLSKGYNGLHHNLTLWQHIMDALSENCLKKKVLTYASTFL